MARFKEDLRFPLGGTLYTKMREYAVWYSGEPDFLTEYYNTLDPQNIFNTQYQVRKNNFWARQAYSAGTSAVHIPLAGSIAELSADLLFAEAPAIKLDEAFKEDATNEAKESQEELDQLLSNVELNKECLQGAELAAAIGGVYMKIAFDEDLIDRPILQLEQMDNAIAKFRYGILTEVSFFNAVFAESASAAKQNGTTAKVYRLVETYTNKGTIEYELYEGTCDKLGTEIGVESREETSDLEDIDTGYDEILCQYVPNMLPNRISRDSYIGRSDLQGLETLMLSLDESYSSWMRDIKLSKAKIIVPATWLEERVGDDSGTKETTYDTDRALYAKLNIDPVSMTNLKAEAVQFKIRADEFEKTCMNLIERAVSLAGYAPQSFGINIAGRVESGTALAKREGRSEKKKVKKESFWQTPLNKVVQGLIFIHNQEFGGSIMEDSNITIEFSDGVAYGITELADAVQKIRAAKAASTKTIVMMLHADWTDEQVDNEVEKIIAEDRAAEFEDPAFQSEVDRFNQLKDQDNNEE